MRPRSIPAGAFQTLVFWSLRAMQPATAPQGGTSFLRELTGSLISSQG
jgi:hypothetical protein